MRRTILSVAYPLTEVGPDTVGGSEQVLTLLDRRLTEEGHQSLVLAAEGSKVKGKLIASPSYEGKLDETIRSWARKVHRQLIRESLQEHQVDLIHFHSLDFHEYLPATRTPVLATLHLPPDWYPRSIFQLRRSAFYMNCVSSSQRRACPPTRTLLPSISNGVDLRRLCPNGPKKNYVLALGRICPEKGFHHALDAARVAGVEMILAGEVFPYPAHVRYYKSQIAPRLDRKRRFVGAASFAQKRKLLAQARCLLIASSVAETSSLVAMEALACGTPVVAFPNGALPEIIEQGRTGFIVNSTSEMAKAITKAAKLDPAACRSAAETRFNAADMLDRYLGTYETIIHSFNQSQEKDGVRAGTSWLVPW